MPKRSARNVLPDVANNALNRGRPTASALLSNSKLRIISMDMNQLFYHHQMAVIAADRTHRKGEAPARFDLPNHYARRINQFRAKRGLEPDFVGYSSAHARRPVPMIKAGSGAIALDIAQHRPIVR